MSALDELAHATSQRPLVLTIGVFDGVHLGHRHLFESLKELAAHHRCQGGVITFRNHPLTVLQPGTEISYLASLEERIQLLRQTDIDYVAPITFTLELSRLSPGEFLEEIRHYLDFRGLVVGPDFALGHHRQGTIPVLQGLGRDMGFFVETVEPLHHGDEVVSSTVIRRALAQGAIPTVSRLLGRPYRLMGRVIHGEGRGRGLGFPTANLLIPPELAMPADGIYATWALIDSQWRKSSTYIGERPTFGEGPRAVEALVLDFKGDLYHQEMTLDFVQRLRGDITFPDAQALIEQVQKDMEQAREVLVNTPPP